MLKIPVHIEGIERRKRSTGLLHVVAGFFLIANAGTYNQLHNYEQFTVVAPVYVVALLSLIYGFRRKRIDPQARYNHWLRLLQFIIFAVLGLLMVNLGKTLLAAGLFLWAVITLLLLFTERKVFHDTALQLKEDGIYVPGYFKDHVLPWTIVEELVLRQDYVTILRKDKKYVQLELLSPVGPAETEQINRYSKQQIAHFSQHILES
jgi:hypothetical protein